MGAAPPESDFIHRANFRVFVPTSVFHKAEAPEGEQMRIGGLISAETEDLDEETILQDGLDLRPFLEDGCFNDDHKRGTTDMLGIPTEAYVVKKGQQLPDGTVAPCKATWAEGYLLPEYRKSIEVFELGKSLAKTQGARRLGFSLEGAILERRGPRGKTVSKARVDDVAITRRPKNRTTGVSVLAKALRYGVDPDVVKAATAADVGKTGEGGYGVTIPEQLDSRLTKLHRALEQVQADVAAIKSQLTRDSGSDVLRRSQAFLWALDRIEGISLEKALELVDTTADLRRKGLL